MPAITGSMIQDGAVALTYPMSYIVSSHPSTCIALIVFPSQGPPPPTVFAGGMYLINTMTRNTTNIM